MITVVATVGTILKPRAVSSTGHCYCLTVDTVSMYDEDEYSIRVMGTVDSKQGPIPIPNQKLMVVVAWTKGQYSTGM